MNRRNWIWVLALVVFIGIILLLLFSRKSKYEWVPNMKVADSRPQPYNLDFFYKLISKKFGGNVIEFKVEDNIEKNTGTLFKEPENTVYLYCGKYFHLNQKHAKLLDSFVARGGTVFFSAPSIPDTLFEKFNLFYTQYSPEIRDSINIEFYNKNLKPQNFLFVSKYKDRATPFPWSFIDISSSMWGSSSVAAISGKKGEYGKSNLIDFFRIKYGAGKYYFHVNTLMLSNLYLTQKETRPYFNHILSHLNGKKLIIDHSLRLIKIDDKLMSPEKQSIIDFILSNNALRYAWFLLITGLITFLLISGKRKQAEIPVMEKPKNNTFRFIQTISYFYWKRNSANLMYERECNQFLQYIKEHLNLKIDPEKEFPIDLIAEKSGVERQTIVNISMYLKERKLWDGSGSLANLCRETGKFYEEHKKHNGKYQRTRVVL